MKNLKIKLAGVVLCGLLLTQTTVAAFEVVETNVEQLNSTTALFTISFEYGFLNRDYEMPIRAARTETPSTNAINYGFYSANGQVLTGVGPAVVLTNDEDVTLTDAVYSVPRGKNATFTLLGLLQLPETESFDGIQMQITNIPTVIIDNDERAIIRIPADQLPDYQTQYTSYSDGLSIKGDVPMIHVK
jgi:hypothetical protein